MTTNRRPFFLAFLTILFIFNLTSTTAAQESTTTSKSPTAKTPQITLTSIEDVEMLTYFLLWKHDYFDNAPDLNSIQGDLEEDSNRLSESKLREFIEKLKINHLITNHSPSRFNLTKECNDNEAAFGAGKQTAWFSPNSGSGSSFTANYNSSKTKAICEAASGCRSAKQLTDLIGLQFQSEMSKLSSSSKPVTLSQSIARLCPLMLFQLQEKECVDARENHSKAKNKPSAGAVWGFGTLFVTIVSFCSLSGVGILPFFTDTSYEILITVLQGLAVGSLLGSALFHLIPQAFNLITSESSSEQAHEYLYRALIIFGGIYLFFWSERLMKIVSEYRRKRKGKGKAVEISSLPSNTNSIEVEAVGGEKYRQVLFSGTANHVNGNLAVVGEDSAAVELFETSALPPKELDHQLGVHANLLLGPNSHNHSHHHHKGDKGHDHHSHNGDGEIATIAWMIILGDGLHNFIDGITIGAAFSQSIMEGISISVAVICEEFPHELGDFAILISSGMSMRKAVGYNFLSACTCYLGMVVGILLGDMADATPYVFALAGGMFLYISLVDMMGELSSNLEAAGRKRGLGFTAKMLVLQNAGILLGIGIMFFLAKYSDKIHFDGLVPPTNSDMPFS